MHNFASDARDHRSDTNIFRMVFSFFFRFGFRKNGFNDLTCIFQDSCKDFGISGRHLSLHKHCFQDLHSSELSLIGLFLDVIAKQGETWHCFPAIAALRLRHYNV